MENVINVMKRREMKFVLKKSQVEPFLEALEGHMKLDRYGLTSIASVYFDTPDCLLINRSIEKPEFKEKIRLRSYGLAKDGSTVYLEIKRKVDGIVYKRRIPVTEPLVEGFLHYQNDLGDSQIAKEIAFFRDHYGTLLPQYLIIYDRKAYFQEDGDLRVTIDLNPRYRSENVDLHTSMEGTPLLGEGEAILEIKAQSAIPLWLTKALSGLGIYQSSFSKVGAAFLKENRHLRGYLPVTSRQVAKGGYHYGLTV